MATLVFSIFIFSLLDLIWIKLVMLPLYENSLIEILLVDSTNQLTVRPVPSLLAYGLLVFSLWYFVIRPYHNTGSLNLLLQAAIFGFCYYGCYALTCWSLFKGFHATLAIFDMCWGGCLYALSSWATVFFAKQTGYGFPLFVK